MTFAMNYEKEYCIKCNVTMLLKSCAIVTGKGFFDDDDANDDGCCIVIVITMTIMIIIIIHIIIMNVCIYVYM